MTGGALMGAALAATLAAAAAAWVTGPLWSRHASQPDGGADESAGETSAPDPGDG